LWALLDENGKACGDVAVATIVGTAGVGKTALAVRWAHEAADRFPDGQLYVDLSGFGASMIPVAPADAVRRMLDALAVPSRQVPSDPVAQRDLYRSLVAGRRMLIVLDNARDAAQVRPLLPGGPGSMVVVTSRIQLTGLVAVEGAHPLPLDVLTLTEATDLLSSRLGLDRITAEPGAAGELAELCARLPLALAIVAARAGVHPKTSFAGVVQELRDSATRLDGFDVGEDLGVRAVLSWSYQGLPTAARRMFRLLGVHPGPDITVAATASLAGVGQDQARALLRQLAEAHLLTERTSGRFGFHDLLRAYSCERGLREDSDIERSAAVGRTLEHYLYSGYRAAIALRPGLDPIGLDQPAPGVVPESVADYEQAMAWFEAEHHVLTLVENLALSGGFDTHGWQLAVCLNDYLERRGYFRNLQAISRRALAAAERTDDRRAQALAHRIVGRSASVLGSHQEADHHFEQMLTLSQQFGDRVLQGHACLGLGVSGERQGKHDDGLDRYQQALSLYQSVGDRAWQALILNNVGWSQAHLGNYQQALESCQQAIELLREIGDKHTEALCWDSIGFAQHHLARPAEAISSYRQALALCRHFGDRIREAEILDHLADAYHADAQPQLATDAWRQSLAILDEFRSPCAAQIRLKFQVATP
jgi:tetratricopeptide (TPR) repeat protein